MIRLAPKPTQTKDPQPAVSWRCSCGYASNLTHFGYCARCGTSKPVPPPVKK